MSAGKRHNLQGQVVRLETIKLHLENEIERLNKELDKTRLSELNKEYIINELEKYLQNEIHNGRSQDNMWLMGCYDEDRKILDKLQELKGSE